MQTTSSWAQMNWRLLILTLVFSSSLMRTHFWKALLLTRTDQVLWLDFANWRVCRFLAEKLVCIFFDCAEHNWLDLYRPILKQLAPNQECKRVALSSLPSTTSKHLSSLFSTLSLEQIVFRSVDDPDIALHLKTKHTYQIALSGKLVPWRGCIDWD